MNRSNFDFYMGGISGFLWAFVAILLIAAFGDVGELVEYVKQYQTLISGLIALIGAVFTVIYIRKQIGTTVEINNQARADKLESKICFLPSALSIISKYIRESVEFIVDNTNESNDEQLFEFDSRGKDFPVLPERSQVIIGDVIELAEPQPRHSLAGLLRQLQIQTARLESYKNTSDTITSHELASKLFHNIEIYAYINNSFDYARRNSDKIKFPLVNYDIYSASVLLKIDDDEYSVVHEFINSYRN